MTINFASKTIEMTKAESKAAGKFGSEAYKELTTIMQQFPTFTIQVITRTSVKKSSEFKGLTYSYMEAYIAGHDQDGAIKKVYDELRLIGACHKVSYPTIKKWFLETYPEIVEFGIDGAA